MRYAAGLLATAVLSVLGSQSPLGQTMADPSEAGAAQATLQFQECLRAIEAQAETRGISKAIYEHLRVLSPRHEVLPFRAKRSSKRRYGSTSTRR